MQRLSGLGASVPDPRSCGRCGLDSCVSHLPPLLHTFSWTQMRSTPQLPPQKLMANRHCRGGVRCARWGIRRSQRELRARQKFCGRFFGRQPSARFLRLINIATAPNEGCAAAARRPARNLLPASRWCWVMPHRRRVSSAEAVPPPPTTDITTAETRNQGPQRRKMGDRTSELCHCCDPLTVTGYTKHREGSPLKSILTCTDFLLLHPHLRVVFLFAGARFPGPGRAPLLTGARCRAPLGAGTRPLETAGSTAQQRRRGNGTESR